MVSGAASRFSLLGTVDRHRLAATDRPALFEASRGIDLSGRAAAEAPDSAACELRIGSGDAAMNVACAGRWEGSIHGHSPVLGIHLGPGIHELVERIGLGLVRLASA